MEQLSEVVGEGETCEATSSEEGGGVRASGEGVLVE